MWEAGTAVTSPSTDRRFSGPTQRDDGVLLRWNPSVANRALKERLRYGILVAGLNFSVFGAYSRNLSETQSKGLLIPTQVTNYSEASKQY